MKEFVKPGENVLLVRLSCGLEYVSDADLAEIQFEAAVEGERTYPPRGDKRRAFLRKPTYVFGWDWCPRIGTVAIAKNAYIDCYDCLAIRDSYVHTVAVSTEGGAATLAVNLDIELLDIQRTADADITIAIEKDGKQVAQKTLPDQLMCSGINYIRAHFDIENTSLWWPNGMGDQPLYTVVATAVCRGKTTEVRKKFGIRTIALDTARMDEKNRRFAVVVNGQSIFCKGGDWIPADSIYARVSPEKYDTLILEAKNANFNMLRIWGGGLYERDEFYDACDRYGILIWQDMMFGCATYPDHLDRFWDLVAREVDYQTKRLRSYACLALFCGNNENHWIYNWEGFSDILRIRQVRQYGLKISNVMLPEYLRKNCSYIPYWNSSPYGGESEPGAANVGDVHHWGECMMNSELENRVEPKRYDDVLARFVSEYGYPGPCTKETVEAYFDGKPIDRTGDVWNWHNNTFEKLTVNYGINKHYTGRELGLDEYLLYAGVAQSLMLGYSLESMRFKDFCGGGLFWMYNDCWGEVGWTIIDYYLRRKISFYGVKRAFEPVKLILRQEGDDIICMAANDTGEAISLDIAYGYMTFDGQRTGEKKKSVTLLPHSRAYVLRWKNEGQDTKAGLFYAMPEGAPALKPAILRSHDARQLCLAAADFSLSEQIEGENLVLCISAKNYVHCICIALPDGICAEDNYFELLPGETRRVTLFGAAGKKVTVDALKIDPQV